LTSCIWTLETSLLVAVLVVVSMTSVPVVAEAAEILVSTEVTEPESWANAIPDTSANTNIERKIFFIFIYSESSSQLLHPLSVV